MLGRAACHAHREWRADVAELPQEFALAVEHLDALVARVGGVDVALRVERESLYPVELPLARAGGSPVGDEAAILVELGNAIVGADAVGDVDVARLVPRYIRWPIEARSRNPRSSGPIRGTLPAATATTSSRSTGCGRRVRTNADRFRFTSENQPDRSIGIEFDHLIRGHIDGPDVVLRIDAKPDRGVEAIDVLAPFANEVALGVEQEQLRSAAREGAVVAKRGIRMARSGIDKDLAAGVRPDAGHLADERPFSWCPEQIDCGE